MATPFRTRFVSAVVLVVLLANQLLFVHTAYAARPTAFPVGDATSIAAIRPKGSVPALLDASVATVGRLLLAPALDSDGDPATNPVATMAVPIIRAMDTTAGAVILAAQLEGQSRAQVLVRVPVTFRVWNAAGVVSAQTLLTDAWGAVQADVRLINPSGDYSYQVSTPSYGTSEIRTFRFDPTHAGMTIHATGAELTYSAGSDGELHFTLTSPTPLESGRDEPALVIARRPSAGNAADESALQPVLAEVNAAELSLPFPRLAMEIVDAHTAQLALRLPAGDYRFVGSLTVYGSESHHYFTVPIERTLATSAPVPADAPATWIANLEHEPGQTLVRYEAKTGEAAFGLVDSGQRPALTPVIEPEATLPIQWRTGPFTWQTQKYGVTMAETNALALTHFTYDPIIRRYDVVLHSLAPVRTEEQVQVEVLGVNGTVLQREETTLTFDPAAPTRYAIQLPASLGQPYGVRVTALRPNTARANPVLLSATLLDEAQVTGALAQSSSASGPEGEFLLIASLKNMAAQFMRGDELKAKLAAEPGFDISLVVVAKAFLNILEVEVATVEYTYLPGVWGGGLVPWYQIVEQIAEGFFYNWWTDTKLVLVSGGVNVAADVGVGYTVSADGCPDPEWRDAVETRLAIMADNIDLRFQEALPDGAGEFAIYTPRVPVLLILMIWAEGVARVRPAADSSGLTVRFVLRSELEVSVAVGVDVTVPGSATIALFKNVKKYFGTFVLAIETIAFFGTLSEWKNSGGPCPNPDDINPNPPDRRPPDDRQDVWQTVVNNLTDGETDEETLGTLNMLLTRAQARGLTRAETVITHRLREVEMAHFVTQSAPFYDYLDTVEVISNENGETLRGMIAGTIPISPTMTLTEALVYQNEQAAVAINAEPYPIQMQLLTDNQRVAQQAYLALYGQELEVEAELRDLFFNDTVGVVASGFPYASMAALKEAGVPGQVISLWPGQQSYRRGSLFLPAPYVAPELAPRALIMPSGGMHRIAGSPEAQAWLDEYVRGGGTLLVFTQAFGTDWSALPGGEVTGVGYEEDQRCQQESVRAAMPSPWLAWMGIAQPDIQVDGAFTGWPADANILLLRTSGLYQGYPAMIEYPLGAGRVLATSAYGDWTTQSAIWWGDDWQMTRTLLIRLLLLAEGQDIDDVLTTAPNSDVTVPFSVTNTSVFSATNVRLELPVWTNRLPGYTGNIADLPVALSSGDSTTLTPLLHTPPVMRGVHDWTQVGLFNLKAKVTTANQEHFLYYPRYLHVQSPLAPLDVGLTLHADPVTAHPFEAVTVTATIRNFSTTPRTVILAGTQDLPTDPITVTVAAGGMVTHTYGLVMDQSYFPKAVLYNQSGTSITNAALAVYIGASNLRATPTLPAVIESGAPLTITVSNRQNFWLPATDALSGQVQLTLTSPMGDVIWQATQPIPPLAVGRNANVPFTLGSLPPSMIGTYFLDYALYDEGELQTNGSWRIRSDIQIEGTDVSPTYRVGDTLYFTTTLHNVGQFNLTPSVTVSVPTLAITTTQSVNLPPQGSATIPLTLTLSDDTLAGTYPILVQAEAEGTTRQRTFSFVVTPSFIEVEESLGTSYAPGDTLTVTLRNTGGVHTTAESTLTLGDSRGVVVAQVTDSAPIRRDDTHTLTLTIPNGVSAGRYQLLVTGQDINALRPFGLQHALDISGTAAALELHTDQPTYAPDESITAAGSVTATAGVVSGTLHLNISPAVPDEIIVGTVERVNANDEIGHVIHDSVQLAYDGAGNAYALWTDDRAYKDTPAIYFSYRPLGGAWQPSVRVIDAVESVAQGNADLVVDAAGNAWAAWTGAAVVGSNKEISVAYRPAGGTWSNEEQVASLPSGLLQQPALALGGDGSLYVAWEQYSPNTNAWDIYFAMRSPDGVWSAAERVTDDTTTRVQHAPAMVVDSTNTVHVIWEDHRQNNVGKIYYANRPAGGVWSANSIVAAGSDQDQPALTIDATDTLYAVWFDGSNTFGIFFATRPVNGNWSSKQRATTGGDFDPQVAIASSGIVHLLFQRNFLIYHATRSIGGVWSSATRINDTTVGGQREPTLAIAADGTALAAWEDSRGPTGFYQPLLRVDERPIATGEWGTDVSLSDASGNANQHRPDVTIDANGTLHAVWEDGRVSSASGVGVYYAVKPIGGTWSVNERAHGTVPANLNVGYPTLAVDGTGGVVALWRANQPDLFSADRSGAGVWSTPVQVDAPGASASNADVAVDSNGNGYVVWTNSVSGNNDIYFAYRPVGGAWGTGGRVNDDIGTRAQTDAQIALDGAGNGYALWRDGRNGAGDIYFAYRPAGGVWSANVRVNDDSNMALQEMPSLSVDAAGNAHAAWVDWRDGSNQIYRAYRPAGGIWSANERVPTPPSTCPLTDPVIAVHPDGAITLAWEDCGIQLTHRSADGGWYDAVVVANAQARFGDDAEIKMVLDGEGNAHLVWEAETTNQYDIQHRVVYLPQGSARVWDRDVPINTATSLPISETVGVLDVEPGKYHLSGTLTNPLSQTLATDAFPFYIFPPGIALTLESDQAVYRPNQLITLTGQLTNTGDTTTTYTLTLLAGEQTLLQQPFTLTAGAGVTYSTTTTATNDMLLTVRAGAAEITDAVLVRTPEGIAQLTVPEVVGSDPFSATLAITNTELLTLGLQVLIGDGLTQSLTVLPGAVGVVAQTLVITGSTLVSATVRGDLNEDLEGYVQWGEGGYVEWVEGGGGEEFLPNENESAGLLPFIYRVSGNLLPTPATLSYRVDAGQPISQSLILSDQSYTNTLLLDLAAGTHTLEIWLATSNGAIFSQDTLTVTINPNEPFAPPNIEILDVTIGGFLERGASARPFTNQISVQVTVANRGPSAFVVAGVQIADTPQQWVITPTAYTTETFTFDVSLPDDLPTGDYMGNVVVDDHSLPFIVPVVGSDVDFSLALDDSAYTAGEPVSLAVTLTEQAGITGDYPLALRYGDYEDTITMTIAANTTVVHTFSFTATEKSRASVTLAQDLPVGQRVIMIDSLPIEVVDPEPGAYLTFDKNLYQAGETVNLTLNVTEIVASVLLVGPIEYQFTEEPFMLWSPPTLTDTLTVVTGTHTVSYTLPAALKTGKYTFDLYVNGESHPYTVDVRGWTVSTRRMMLDQAHYNAGDTIAATAEFINEGDTLITGLQLNAYVFQPDGTLVELSPPVSTTVELGPGLNVVPIEGTLVSDMVGPHTLLINLTPPDKLWRVAGASAQFDVGSAHLVELTTNHGIYAPGQAATGRLDVYGHGATQLVVTASDGSTVLDITPILAGFEAFTFAIPTTNEGDYLLTATSTDVEGTDDTLTRAYAVPPPFDTESPIVTLTYPTTTTILTSDAPTMTITVTGNASDNREVVQLLVNGNVVTPTVTGAFTTTVTLRRGTNGVSATAMDPSSNLGYSPLVPLTLVPTRSSSLTVSQTPAQVGTTIFFESVISTGDVLSDVLWSMPLPTTMVTDVVVMASSGTTNLNTITPGVLDAVWHGDLTEPVTVTVSVRLISPGTLAPTATVFWGWAINDNDSVSVEVVVPTGVTLTDFSATPIGNAIRVTWETASETDNLGFNLWRSTAPDAPGEQLNDELILSQSPGGGQGAVYEWLDDNVETGVTYYYWLEAVSLNGTKTEYGPVSATMLPPTALTLATIEVHAAPAWGWLALLLIGVGWGRYWRRWKRIL